VVLQSLMNAGHADRVEFMGSDLRFRYVGRRSRGLGSAGTITVAGGTTSRLSEA
jgi:hypothetical protein